ncbi:hypothetical protein GCM10023163_29020 [Aestuariibaculum suncheonense]
MLIITTVDIYTKANFVHIKSYLMIKCDGIISVLTTKFTSEDTLIKAGC